MGEIKKVLPVKLIFSVIFNNKVNFENIIKVLEKNFGEIEVISDRLIFDHTNYYNKEMGNELFRHFIVFRKLWERENIANVKIDTNNIEKNFSDNGNRNINIDPGYLTMENFILFTTKNYTHRIYLQKGIYADLTLIYQKKQFQSLPWTYPDYAGENIRNFLKKIRESYVKELKKIQEF